LITGSILLATLPIGLRDPLLAEYRGIVTAFAEGRWKLSALDAGRFCEVVYTILDGALSGTFAAVPSKPSRFPEACRVLESRPVVGIGDRSLRILIPRVLPALYEIRNNRDVGHVGGDVSANKMDATFVRDSATWVLAELVRIFHSVTVTEAQASVDALVERTHPIVWEHEGKRRVLDVKMSAKDKILVLLHGLPSGASPESLQEWIKYKVNFRRQVLEPLASNLLVECNADWSSVVITPLGIARVERDLLPS
jgi:hypothetical protein